MLTMPNKELYLNCERDYGFFMYNLAQSRFETTNRCFSHNRNEPFYLERKMFNKIVYMKIYNKKYYQIHKEERNKYEQSFERKEYLKRWRQTPKGKECMKRWRQSPKGKKHLKQYQEYWKQSSKGKNYHKYWDQSPKGKLCFKTAYHNRRLKTKDLTTFVIQQVYEENIKRYGTLTCYLCTKPILFGEDHLEHKTPLSRGGTNTRKNLDVACQHCNLSKHTKTEIEYRNGVMKNG